MNPYLSPAPLHFSVLLCSRIPPYKLLKVFSPFSLNCLQSGLHSYYTTKTTPSTLLETVINSHLIFPPIQQNYFASGPLYLLFPLPWAFVSGIYMADFFIFRSKIKCHPPQSPLSAHAYPYHHTPFYFIILTTVECKCLPVSYLTS